MYTLREEVLLLKKFFFLILLPLIIVLTSCPLEFTETIPNIAYKQVILIIGDGMGAEQVKAAGYYAYGQEGLLSFEQFPAVTTQTTYSASSSVTDSAASASAMATGKKVNNGVLSMEIPGNGNDLQTILEIAQEQGKATGLVTTTISVHATPAAFAAHVPSRNNYQDIASHYMHTSRPDVIFAGGDANLTVSMAEDAGYLSATDKTRLSNLTYIPGAKYFGYFGNTHLPYMYDGMGTLPELSDMTRKALDVLEEADNGFFLMIEGGRIDHAGHQNDLIRNIGEVLELSDTVEYVIDWAIDHPDTLVIVTADHETGGLSVTQNNGVGNLPSVTWSTTGHTATPVPAYVWGSDAQRIAKQIDDNTDIFASFFTSTLR
jgi:alkaline phosphatase